MKFKQLLFIFLVLMLGMAACSTNVADSVDVSVEAATEIAVEMGSGDASSAQTVAVVAEDIHWPGYDDEDLDARIEAEDMTRISLSDHNLTVQGEGVTVAGNTLTITSGGVYQVAGSLSEGQIVVDTQDEEVVRLILNGIQLISSSTVPVHVINADKTVITLADGTVNVITDLSADAAEDGEANAAVFSNDDLTINGMGNLTVNSENHHGIASDDDLKIVSGTIRVNALKNGIQGRDSIAVQDGIITITAGSDGLTANNDVDAGEGNIFIEGGIFEITVAKDGIQADNILAIGGGEFTITSGGGSAGVSVASMDQWGDWDQQNPSDASDISAKGLKAGVQLLVTGGIFTVDSADDALHSNHFIQIDGGDFSLASGDDGLHADTSLEINSGAVNITQSYEGLESAAITINNGRVEILARDDGINGSSGTSIEGMGGGRGGQFESGDCSLVINGGSMTITADGDGIDINGTIVMNAGVLLINGPTGNMNGALDFLGSFTMKGGLLIAVGSAGMAQAPSATSTQPAFLYNFNEVQQAGTLIHVESSSGEEILTFVPTKTFQSVVVSSPEFEEGETYVIYAGGSVDGDVVGGLYTGSVYTPGTQVEAFTFSEVVMSLGAIASMGGPGGGVPGRGRP
jgi:hypothetical protein